MTVDLESTGVDELADGLDCVRVTHDNLLGNRLGAAVIAVDPHCGEHGQANDLGIKVECKLMASATRI